MKAEPRKFSADELTVNADRSENEWNCFLFIFTQTYEVKLWPNINKDNDTVPLFE